MTTFPIPWSLSVYGLVHDKSPHNIYSSYPRHFLRWSRDIEDRVSTQSLGCDLYVGFEFLSNFIAQKQRYAALSKTLTNIWVFAQPDQPQSLPDGLSLVGLTPAHKLAREWFLLVNHPRYARLFVAREFAPDLIGNRQWMGILSSDRDIISDVESALRKHLVSERATALI